ncbi:uncharacterized protein LOC123022600 [Varanus komodoensis]|uniref:Uncharacterized protein n=1 Tax=Varanus komodoensis TaxID=61221 RepID=A0A8D2LWT3_VARKO|nr:uncharacterized protein LOC123022600 [Varanus komodoensis]XP_044284380.1 uncharacterized protein LOC123022600 [Varanus komodoensis]XP_044284381.1 uncharacterized protein LOC123022600 [Varanus komodoensis]XP_044284382.1 uncharacterized protein LOC123022600 [Varanus komodoensis]XP_044284383.1 uncharacterized protein LOC123022600 [Varanus komodoensis]
MQDLMKMMSAVLALLALFFIMQTSGSHVTIHYTSSGGICGDMCGYHGYGYTWCRQSGGNGNDWDYCSLEEGLDASGANCASSCDVWGGSYRYCYLKNGGWHYCGLVGQQEALEYSQENHRCLTSCQTSNGSFQCKTAHGTERCSPFRDVTPTGLPCNSNYRCAKYGHSVYRCHLDESDAGWDHCGRKSLDRCVWVHTKSNSSQVEYCTLFKSQMEGKVIFRRERQDNMLSPTKAQFQRAVRLIDQIDSVRSLPMSGDQAEIRLYKQEDISCKGINYTNVELQIISTTAEPIAHVIFPESLTTVHTLRLAFYTSLHSAFYSPAYSIAVSTDEPMLCSMDHQ